MGEFERAIRKQKSGLHPTRRELNFEDFRRAYSSFRTDDRDDELFRSGEWIYTRLLEARKIQNEIVKSLKSGTPVLRLAIAEINRQFRSVEARIQTQIKQLADNEQLVNPGVVQHLSLNDNGTNEFDSEDVVTIWGEATGYLFRVFEKTTSDIYYTCSTDTLEAIRELIKAAMIIVQLEDHWRKCLWLGHTIQADERYVQICNNRTDIARTITTSHDRFNNNCLAVFGACINGWRRGIRLEPCIDWVSAVSVREKEITYQLSNWMDKNEPPRPYIIRRASLSEVPVELLQKSLTNFKNVTASDIFDAVEALQSLGLVFFERRNASLEDEVPTSWIDSPVISTTDCIRLIGDACKFDEDKARQVINVLTLTNETKRDGAWEAPLIPAGGNAVYISFPTLLTSNPLRYIDHWLIGGGITQKEKGRALEKIAREKLASALSLSKVITDGAVYMDGLRLEGNNGPEIDALIRIGNTVLVCEIKSLIFPVTPLEIHNYLEQALDKGVQQAIEECELAKKHRKTIAKLTNYSGNPDALNLIKAVLVRGRIGSGLIVNDVPILDIELLAEYLKHNRIEFIFDAKSPQENGSECITLYDSQQAAEKNLEPYLRCSPKDVLRHSNIVNARVSKPYPYGGQQIIADNYILPSFASLEEMKAAVGRVRNIWESMRAS